MNHRVDAQKHAPRIALALALTMPMKHYCMVPNFVSLLIKAGGQGPSTEPIGGM